MAYIELKNISVEFPVLHASARSIKNSFLRLATGAHVMKDAKQQISVRALNNLNITLATGDRLALIGHNGAGKSTLLRLLAGIYEPTQGVMRLSGKVTSMLDIMQGIEMEFSGHENIMVRGILMGLSRQEIAAKTQEIVQLTGLGDYLAMPMRTYSSGMKIRLAFAISTFIDPDILLIDEVFGAGDADFVQTAHKKMISLLNQSNIVVLASHSIELLKRFCNKGLLLEGGQVKCFGTIDHVLDIYTSRLKQGA